MGIDLNEVGRCKSSASHTTSYDAMNGSDLSSGLFKSQHNISLTVPSLTSLGLDSFNPNARGQVNLYLRCQDKNGNSDPNEYAINFCVKQGNDTTPAGITGRSPKYEKVPFNTTNVNASIYLREPAECRWDTTQNKTYYQMSNNMSCVTDLNARDPTTGGWKCSTNFDFALSKNQTTYYIRCLDQPWLTGENSTKRNANANSYPFNIIRTQPLKIENVNVENKTFTFAVDPATLQVNFSTSGGYDGTATCSFVYDTRAYTMEDTNGLRHSQNLQVSNGEFNRNFICKDIIGNSVEKNVRAIINIRTTAPLVTRTYTTDNTLTIATDEPSTCFYSNDDANACWYDMNNGTQMAGSLSLIHI